jgi:hypothetical protein
MAALDVRSVRLSGMDVMPSFFGSSSSADARASVTCVLSNLLPWSEMSFVAQAFTATPIFAIC